MGRQGELFDSGAAPFWRAAAPAPPPLLRAQLLAWQGRIAAHQHPLFTGGEAAGERHRQGTLFQSAPGPGAAAMNPVATTTGDPALVAARFDPMTLRAESLSFWRWPSAPHQGAALYLVTDLPEDAEQPLLLYVGETARADRRWKGEHDCKSYLAAYSEALTSAGLQARLGIRFWCDVPAAGPARRALEQAMIRRWQPPFNKETRGRWATPFTAEAD